MAILSRRASLVRFAVVSNRRCASSSSHPPRRRTRRVVTGENSTLPPGAPSALSVTRQRSAMTHNSWAARYLERVREPSESGAGGAGIGPSGSNGEKSRTKRCMSSKSASWSPRGGEHRRPWTGLFAKGTGPLSKARSGSPGQGRAAAPALGVAEALLPSAPLPSPFVPRCRRFLTGPAAPSSSPACACSGR